MDESSKISRFLIILLMPTIVLGTLGDHELSVNGAKLIWNNNSQTFSISASGSMSESVNYIWPPADGAAGQAIITNGSGVLSFTAPSTSFTHDILSVTHTDTVANAVTRGSIIYGNSTPKWDELVIGASIGSALTKILGTDGTDSGFRTIANFALDIDSLLDHGNFAGLGDDDHTIYSLADGTRDFSGVVVGVFPTASAHLVTKEYVDSAITFVEEYYFNDTVSNIGGIYFKMLDTPTGEGESTFTIAGLGTGDDQALTNFATDAGVPGLTFLEMGVYDGHIHAEKTVGTKPVKIHFEIYSRATDTTETLITTSEESDFITSKVEVDIHAVLSSDVTIATTDRIIVKWLANVDATGSAATIVLYAEGVNSSRLKVPISSNVLNQIYIRQDGTKELTANWDAGSFDIRAQTGTFDSLTSGRVAFVSTNGLLVDDAGLTYASATDILTAGTYNATDEDDVLQVDGTCILRTGTAANKNIFIGEGAFVTDDGTGNVGIGVNAGGNVVTTGGGTSGTNNIFIGKDSGVGAIGSTANFNVGLGERTLFVITSGGSNMAIGAQSMRNLTSGSSNVGIGEQALLDITTGRRNMAIGKGALGNVPTSSDDNVAIGNEAGFGGGGDIILKNVLIGTSAGFSLADAVANIFIGYKAGINQTTNDNLLILDNQDRGSAALELTNSLIYGVFNATPASQSLRVNAGTFILGNPTHSDADGGGAVLFQSIREDGAGTPTIAGQIEISHDGVVANDQLGKIVHSVNTGAGLVEGMRLDSSLGITFAGALAGAWDMGSQALTNVNIDSGVITGITDLTIADGGTGQSTAQTAIDALTAVSGATNEHVLTKDTGTGNAVWKVSSGGGGATAWDDIVDPDAAATIDFTTYTQTLDIGVTDTGGPKSGLILDVTGLGAGASDVIALEITTATNDDTDYIPIAIYDDSGGDNDLLFKIGSGGEILGRSLTLNFEGKVRQDASNTLTFTDNDDIFNMVFGGTDCDLTWSDGVFNIRNAENGVDAIVEIEGKDAGEKGILRVLSDGDDKYIELYHDDTDAHIVSSSGDIQFTASGIVYNPSGTQAITGAGDTLLANSVVIVLNPDGDYTMTSAPTIANGSTGQILYMICANGEVNTVTVQDQNTLANSNLHLGAASRAISGKDVLTLLFDGTTWNEVSYANN